MTLNQSKSSSSYLNHTHINTNCIISSDNECLVFIVSICFLHWKQDNQFMLCCNRRIACVFLFDSLYDASRTNEWWNCFEFILNRLLVAYEVNQTSFIQIEIVYSNITFCMQWCALIAQQEIDTCIYTSMYIDFFPLNLHIFHVMHAKHAIIFISLYRLRNMWISYWFVDDKGYWLNRC